MIKISRYFPVFLIIYELAVNLSNDMYLPAVSSMMQFFQTNDFFIQLSLTSWFAGAMIMNPVLGVLSDNAGRKRVLLYSGFAFLAATLYCAIPGNIYLFLAARFLQGLTVTSIVVCGYALIHELYENDKAIMIIAWMSGALIVAPMLGPLMGGLIITALSWHYIFIALFFVAAVALIGLYYVMPHTLPVNADEEKFNLKNEMATYKNILLSPKFLIGSLVYGLLFGGLIAWITASPFLIVVNYQYSPLTFGFIQIPIFGSFIAGILALKLFMKLNYCEEKIIQIGMISLAIASIAVLLKASFGQVSLPALIIFMCVYSLAFGLVSSPLNRITVMSVPYGMGKIMAMFDLILGILATLATVLINVNADNMTSYIATFITVFTIISLPFYIISQFLPGENHESSAVG